MQIKASASVRIDTVFALLITIILHEHTANIRRHRCLTVRELATIYMDISHRHGGLVSPFAEPLRIAQRLPITARHYYDPLAQKLLKLDSHSNLSNGSMKEGDAGSCSTEL